jgi:two-component system, sensor histidine kinase PdtaS
MKYMYVIIVLLLNFNGKILCQNIPAERIPLPGDEKQMILELNNAKTTINKIEALLNLSAYYLYLHGEEKPDLEKAMMYAEKAKALSANLKFQDGYNESMVLTGKILHEKGEENLSKLIFDSTFIYINQVIQSCKENNNPLSYARALRQLADMRLSQDRFIDAEKVLLELITLYRKNNFPNLHHIYDRLTTVAIVLGDFNKGLQYGLEMMKSMETCKDYSSAGSFYINMGYVYLRLGQLQKGLDYYNIAYNYFKKTPTSVLYYLKTVIAETLIKMNRGKEALLELQNIIKDFPPNNIYENKEIEKALGNCYNHLKQYDLAEYHLKKADSIEKKRNDANEILHMNRRLAEVYSEWGKFDLAKLYIEKCLNSTLFRAAERAELLDMLYKIDSATGNYFAAMKHLKMIMFYEEIASKEIKTKENEELQIKYETEKKDQDIKIKDQDILLLNKQSELQRIKIGQFGLQLQFEARSKEQNLQLATSEAEKKDKDLLVKQQNIELLKKEGELQQSSLKQTKTSRSMIIGGATMLLLLLILLYHRYRVKQRNSKQMKDKNMALQRLLIEKEWLLKEVHHRVKNNLQTVVSLLESQSAYLKDDALLAIHDSQNRVHAMSLIHQKLYQAENVSSINMLTYLPELVNYLAESFNLNNIHFDLQLEPVELDVSQAIPLGLIVNEALTNSFKYAFPGDFSHKLVGIYLKQKTDKLVELKISDNGVGLPEDFGSKKGNGLGIKLIKGLTDDLEGKLLISGDKGTVLTIIFTATTTLSDIAGAVDSKLTSI